jgi:UPF0755 protein
MKLIIAIVSLVVIIAAGIYGGLWVKGKLDARQARLAAYEAAKNEKAKTIKLTFIEGWTVEENAAYVAKQTDLTVKDYLNSSKLFDRSNYPLLASIPKNYGLDGFLFPDTYEFLANISSDGIIDTQLKTFGSRIKQIAPTYDGGVWQVEGYSKLPVQMDLYKLVTLASIIEKETGQDLSNASNNQKDRLLAERKTVAGIFYNRLMQGGRLESDATINYITGGKRAAPTTQDLEVNSPYNTYKYAGLPPGPICNPSLQSIQAAMYPNVTDYYYFLHKQPSGEVVYAKTYNEHLANKQKYLK